MSVCDNGGGTGGESQSSSSSPVLSSVSASLQVSEHLNSAQNKASIFHLRVAPTFKSLVFWIELQQKSPKLGPTSQLLLFSHALYAYVFENITLYNNLFKL
jgi:hypothetical protein